ncbi:HlyD family secretion protein [Nitrospira moscoviensis]|uniref:Putative Multidrug resistance protein A (Modular protein) n=1 Tax=Nitrospira moscoviensis TaxID=42253 RepID=A0A0K2GF88_NITMO|nr:HlyD family secretion protein [Nitrospira moscoviensis]ALA59625.1 putative Multidrug resistance protein A (Modular protein) [Nitrospira moscoviensis]
MSTTHSVPPPAPHLYEESLHAQRNRRLLLVALVLALAGLAYGVYWWTTARYWIQTDNAYVTGNLVPVAAQASGIITQVLFEETQFVNRGDVMIRLDEHEAYAALGRARGRLGDTVRRINSLFFTQRQLAEKLAARRARLDVIRHDVDRYRRAAPSGAVSKQILQNALDQLQALDADVRETQAEYDALDAQIGGTTVMEHPAVELAKHEFINAHLEYARQQIRAPVSGYVAKRKAQVGDRVKPGTNLMTIVPLDHLWVEANLRETELRDIRPGQPAEVRVDLYGDRHTFHGTVEGLVPGTGSPFALLPPDNSTGNFIHITERVPVRIALAADEIREHPIRPGLSTVTKIRVSDAGNSVWTSLAKADTEEYHTDVYGDELTSAELLAQGVIAGNVRVTGQGLNVAAGRPVGLDSTAPHDPTTLSDLGRSADGLYEGPRRSPPDVEPHSSVPPRSPDLGEAFFPLSPSIGPGSDRLGPAAGPPPAVPEPLDRRRSGERNLTDR